MARRSAEAYKFMELTKMTEHKLAKLLRQAADDADARFTYPRGMAGNDPTPCSIQSVLANPALDWYLIEKPDPYAELKKAYAEGKTIQIQNYNDQWFDCTPRWDFSVSDYRIKPQTVTKWLWADSLGRVSTTLGSIGYNGYTTKLEWSATEFEVTE